MDKWKYLVVCLSIALISCNRAKDKYVENPDAPPAKAEITPESFDFGTIQEGEKVSYIFKVKNIGGKLLLINDVYASCGCTVPKWSKEPIKPGEIGEIEVIFDSSGRQGVQYKNVTIQLNTEPAKRTVMFQANVVKSNS